ncbi:class I SAM-dependent methyltransferase [Saccharibacillus alkalitolerans]|uniref:Class I SAM-dependent methyltransferase n=1 Tax=Saccharibacillus alkalitolerans TaxID=2705290 RepID=A0ABX0F9S4_9BACL|nr:class I SAM-dependent methyltransferase [Saccharibacillus alkalitolerans]NGZ77657.1 class I SAM-dependent methyltransferase [Saccharibacillus alkalitolerans]
MKNLIDYYSAFDEWGRLEREPLEFTINLHHILANLPVGGRVLDNGAGPGQYAMTLAGRGYRMTLTDLTPRLVEIAEAKAREMDLQDRFDGFYARDARRLEGQDDRSFDAALMLGPMYHLQAAEDRERAISELRRVTKPGGTVFVAFMPRTAFLGKSLAQPESWKPNHTAEGLDRLMATGAFDHADEGRFTGAYYFEVGEIEPFMESRGFECLKLIASSSIAGAMNAQQWEYWRQRGDEEFAAVIRRLIDVSEDRHILGMSPHVLYIGRRGV